MKRIALALLTLIPAIMIACGKSNNNDNSATATTALTTACLQSPYACQNSPYSFTNGTYQQWGFVPYPSYSSYMYQYSAAYNYPTQISSCDCASAYGYGTIAVYSNMGGAGCVSQQVYQPVAGILGIYSLGAANGQWVNITQVSNIPTTQTNSCNQTVQACFPAQANGGCASGYRCATATGAPVGLCVRN